MTGPEHYQEAERLLAKYCGTAEDAIGHGMLAQAHATLALVAVTAYAAADVLGDQYTVAPEAPR